MSESGFSILADVINHNADLLERHLREGVYVHQQQTPSMIWKVRHSLGSLRPLIETYDPTGNRIGHNVNRKSQTFDYCEVVFTIPISGVAIIRF
jgi:hypothetical protein